MRQIWIFPVRCGECGSVSAKDVLVSMAAFDRVEFDESSKIVVVGAGQTWGDVNGKWRDWLLAMQV